MGGKGQVFVPVFLSGRLSKAVEFSYDVGLGELQKKKIDVQMCR